MLGYDCIDGELNNVNMLQDIWLVCGENALDILLVIVSVFELYSFTNAYILRMKSISQIFSSSLFFFFSFSVFEFAGHDRGYM